jgi:hypothetical protein
MRNAIDEFKRYSDAGMLPVELGTDGYPKEPKCWSRGRLIGRSTEGEFLRRIPLDPMTGEDSGVCAATRTVGLDGWGGENIYDVYRCRGVANGFPMPNGETRNLSGRRRAAASPAELIVVIAIIGILATIAAGAPGVRASARRRSKPTCAPCATSSTVLRRQGTLSAHPRSAGRGRLSRGIPRSDHRPATPG